MRCLTAEPGPGAGAAPIVDHAWSTQVQHAEPCDHMYTVFTLYLFFFGKIACWWECARMAAAMRACEHGAERERERARGLQTVRVQPITGQRRLRNIM